MVKHKNKTQRRGFTLVELLAVIVILAIILAIAVPTISTLIYNSKRLAFESNAKLILKAIDYKRLQDNTFNPTTLTKENVGTLLGIDTSNLSSLAVTLVGGKTSLSITGTNKYDGITASGTFDNIVVSDTPAGPILYSDATGASIPELGTGMIPIVYDDVQLRWEKADVTQNWYDYDTKKWANAVLVTNATRATYQSAAVGAAINEADVMAYLVWVPRYKYKLFNVGALSTSPQTIEIVFEKKTDTKSNGTNNGNYLTHPAFTFGSTELTGLWVGKFELTGDLTTPTVKPDLSSIREQTVSTFYNTIRKFDATVDTTGKYGLTTTYDAHMMKNLEWGAIAYLSHSKYGINNEIGGTISNMYYTGGGNGVYKTDTNLSTTGNIYGIYDMAGGAWEYVMGALYNSGNTTLIASESGFDQAVLDGVGMVKYIDKYTYGTTYNDQTAFNRRLLGDATGETNSWYNDEKYFIYSMYSPMPWFRRGGAYFDSSRMGIFAFDAMDASWSSDSTARLVVSY